MTQKHPETGPDSLWGITFIEARGGPRSCALSLRDVHADSDWAKQVLTRMGVRAGMLTMMIGGATDQGRLWPYDKALLRLESTFVMSDAGPYDCTRMEAYLRLFKFDAALNISAANLAGLEGLGHKPEKLFGRIPILAADPAAASKLRACGLQVWSMQSIGPLFAIEAPGESGARYDQSEWLVESYDGELCVTALGHRATPWVRLPTGVRGTVEIKDGNRLVQVAATATIS